MSNRKWKFKFIDAIIVVFVVVLAVLFAKKLMMAQRLTFQDTELVIVLRAEQQYPFVLKHIRVGDLVYQKGSLSPIGKVVRVSVKPATAIATNLHTGELSERVVPDRYNVYLTLTTNGIVSLNGNVIVDNNVLFVNKYLVVHTHRVYLPTRVISIEDKG